MFINKIKSIMSRVLLTVMLVTSIPITVYAEEDYTVDHTIVPSIVGADNWQDYGFKGFKYEHILDNKQKSCPEFNIFFVEDPKEVATIGFSGFTAGSATYNGMLIRFRNFVVPSVKTPATIVVTMKDGTKYKRYMSNFVNGDYTNGGSLPGWNKLDTVTLDVSNDALTWGIEQVMPGNQWDGGLSTVRGTTFEPMEMWLDGRQLKEGTEFTWVDRKAGNNWYTMGCLTNSMLKSIPNGQHSLVMRCKDGTGAQSIWNITGSTAVKSTPPSLTTKTASFDKDSPSVVKLYVKWGVGAAGAMNATVKIDGVPVTGNDRGDYLEVPVSELENLSNGEHTVTVTFDDPSNTVGNCVLTVIGGGKAPSVVDESETFDKTNPVDVQVEVDFGEDDKAATDVVTVKVGDTVVIGVVTGTTLKLDKDDLKDLPDGSYTVTVTFNDKNATEDTFTLVVSGKVGNGASMPEQHVKHDKADPRPVEFEVNPGDSLPDTITVGGIEIPKDNWDYEDGKITIDPDGLKNLPIGEHDVVVNLEDGTKLEGSTLEVVDNGKAPSVTPLVYEYYKGTSEDVEMSVELNDATGVEKITVDGKTIPEDCWVLGDGCVTVYFEYCETLEPGDYQVSVEFNDTDKTVVSNIRLIVYEQIEDSEEPILLPKYVVFTGQDLSLAFTAGSGDYESDHIDALVIEDNVYLPDGSSYVYSKAIVNDLMAIAEFIENGGDSDPLFDPNILDEDDWMFEDIDATPSNATPANARKSRRTMDSPLTARQMDMLRALNTDEPVFTSEGLFVKVDGDWLATLGLKAGHTYLCGSIFHNSVHTQDFKKVTLYIPEDTEKPGEAEKPEIPSKPGTEEKPENPGDSKPVNPSKPGNDNKPEEPSKPVIPSKPSGGSSGGSSGGGGGSSRPSTGTTKPADKNTDGSQNSNYRPNIPDNGGSWSQDSNGSWLYTLPDGEVPKSQWIADGKGWYWFDENGILVYDWFLDDKGDWYMLDKRPETLGRCLYGWYFEQMDQKWYYFDVRDGHMLVGWQFIDGKWYYFTVRNDGQTYFGDNDNGWKYNPSINTKPYGSMFSNEMTPDGYKVAESGEWLK